MGCDSWNQQVSKFAVELNVRPVLLIGIQALCMFVHACLYALSFSQSFQRDVEEHSQNLFQLSSRLHELEFSCHILNVLPPG